MKRWMIILLLVLLLCALAIPAAADLVILPDNNFYKSHRSECVSEDRAYYANGPEGYVLAYTSPESPDGKPLRNGEVFHVSNIYQNRWGLVAYNARTMDRQNMSESNRAYGWVDLNEMVADYDDISFAADHAAEIVETNLELDTGLFGSAACYKYPGSGIVVDRHEIGWLQRNMTAFTAQFVDPEGRTWAYVPKSYNHRDAWWICLDAPNDASLPPDENCVEIVQHGEAPKLGAVGKVIELNPAADEATLRSVAKAHSGARPFVIACAVGMVIVAAAVLIATLRRKEGGKTK